MNAHFDYEYGVSNVKPKAEEVAARNCFIPCYFDTIPEYHDTVSVIVSKLTRKEQILLEKHDKDIFAKCKAAMVNNGIADR